MNSGAMLFTLLSLYRYTLFSRGELAFTYWEETALESTS